MRLKTWLHRNSFKIRLVAGQARQTQGYHHRHHHHHHRHHHHRRRYRHHHHYHNKIEFIFVII